VGETIAARDIVLRRGWLSQTPPSFQRTVMDRCRLQHFAAGDPVYTVGDPPGAMFGLVTGGLAISIAPGEHGPTFAHFAQPGSWFGEASAITGQPRRVGLTATRDTDLLQLPLHAIHEITGQDPGAWRLFAIVTLGHLDVAIGACDDLMIRDHVRRCIAVLLRLGGCRTGTPPGCSGEIDLSQGEIAVLANVARTTLNSVLRMLEESGQLELSYRRIRLLAPESMRAALHD
jgi:CRP-like cAMP-binding protein